MERGYGLRAVIPKNCAYHEESSGRFKKDGPSVRDVMFEKSSRELSEEEAHVPFLGDKWQS